MTVLEVLDDPVAQELLNSRELARLAYTWTDGTPRVVPILFHWTGTELVVASPIKAPKVKVLAARPAVAVTIDSSNFPHHVLMIRGEAQVDEIAGIVPEYAAAAQRYFGTEQANAWLEQLAGMVDGMARISIVPDHVTILDFETRFPNAISA